MKRPALLIASLSLNLVLGGILVWAKNRPAPLLLPLDQTTRTIAPAPHVPAPTIAATLLTNAVTAPFHWHTIESPDYQIYLDNLRALGCPEPRLRDIICADVDALFAARARDYAAPFQSQFWEIVAQPRDLEKTLETHQEALDKLEQERATIFQTLFNERDPHHNYRTTQRAARHKANTDSRLDFLAESKRATLVSIEAELTQTAANIRQAELTGPREAIRLQRETQLREAKAATDQRLRELLSPEEYEEYRLRQSPAASVRSRLARMTVSETEARHLAKASATQLEAEAQLNLKDPATKPAHSELEQRTQEQIKEILGPDRYLEYQRVTDYRYDHTARIIERLELPEQTTRAVYQARLEAENLAAQFRADLSTPAAERAAALNILRTEAENSVRQLLGAKAYQEYQNNSGGWFDSLARPEK